MIQGAEEPRPCAPKEAGSSLSRRTPMRADADHKSLTRICSGRGDADARVKARVLDVAICVAPARERGIQAVDEVVEEPPCRVTVVVVWPLEVVGIVERPQQTPHLIALDSHRDILPDLDPG